MENQFRNRGQPATKRAPIPQLQVDTKKVQMLIRVFFLFVFFIYYETVAIFKLLVLERSHILALNKGGLSTSEKRMWDLSVRFIHSHENPLDLSSKLNAAFRSNLVYFIKT